MPPAVQSFDCFDAGGFDFGDHREAEVAGHMGDPCLLGVEDVRGKLMPCRGAAADRMAEEQVQRLDAGRGEVELDRRVAVGAAIAEDATPIAVQERTVPANSAVALPAPPENREREAAFPVHTRHSDPPLHSGDFAAGRMDEPS
jgi:hypothetical protein